LVWFGFVQFCTVLYSLVWFGLVSSLSFGLVLLPLGVVHIVSFVHPRDSLKYLVRVQIGAEVALTFYLHTHTSQMLMIFVTA